MRLNLPLLLAALPVIAACQRPVPSVPGNGHNAIQEGAIPPPSLARLVDSLAIEKDSIHLVVLKNRRMFNVVAIGDTLKRFPCVLGEVPEGDKNMQGDRRTPEGTFGFRDKYPHRKWHKFAWIDYPNEESWRRFRARKRRGEIPAGATIGGEIGIHGVPDGMDHWIVQGSDWTWGCIALRNDDLDAVWPFIRPGHTVLVILP